MTIDFECSACGADFELDISTLMEDPTRLQCPNCDVKSDPRVVEDLMGALDDVMYNMSHLRRKFNFSITIETDDLPPPYSADAGDDGKEGVYAEEEEEESEK